MLLLPHMSFPLVMTTLVILRIQMVSSSVTQMSGSAIINMTYVINSGTAEHIEHAEFCADFNPKLSPLPSAGRPTARRNLTFIWDKDFCNSTEIAARAREVAVSEAIVVVERSDCTAYDHAIHAKELGAAGVIIVPQNRKELFYPARGRSMLEDFPVLVMTRDTLDAMMILGAQDGYRYYARDWLISVSEAGDATCPILGLAGGTSTLAGPSYWVQVCLAAIVIALLCADAAA